MILKEMPQEELRNFLKELLKPGMILKLNQTIRRSLDEFGSNNCKSKYNSREAEFSDFFKNSLTQKYDYNRIMLKRTDEEIKKSQSSFKCWSFHILDLDLEYLQRYVTVSDDHIIKPVLFNINNLTF